MFIKSSQRRVTGIKAGHRRQSWGHLADRMHSAPFMWILHHHSLLSTDSSGKDWTSDCEGKQAASASSVPGFHSAVYSEPHRGLGLSREAQHWWWVGSSGCQSQPTVTFWLPRAPDRTVNSWLEETCHEGKLSGSQPIPWVSQGLPLKISRNYLGSLGSATMQNSLGISKQKGPNIQGRDLPEN